jgi:non-heme chloroperoxidase
MLRNFSKMFFAVQRKLNPEFKRWNIRNGLTTSTDATIQCSIEFRDTNLRKDMANVQVCILILYGGKDRVCLFVLAQVMHENIKGSQPVKIEKDNNDFYFEEPILLSFHKV